MVRCSLAQSTDGKENMRKIALSGKLGDGKHALVSSADYLEVSRYTWWLSQSSVNQYVYTWARNDEGKIANPRRKLYLHRLITDAPTGREVDHKDRNPLNNQRGNLRVCTRIQNCSNRGPRDDFPEDQIEYEARADARQTREVA